MDKNTTTIPAIRSVVVLVQDAFHEIYVGNISINNTINIIYTSGTYQGYKTVSWKVSAASPTVKPILGTVMVNAERNQQFVTN